MIAKTLETLSGFLQKVPDAAFSLVPGGGTARLLKSLLGDQNGLADGVRAYWQEILAVSKTGRKQVDITVADIGQLFKSGLQGIGGALNSLNPFAGLDFGKWMKGFDAATKAAEGTKGKPYKPSLGKPRNADAAEEAARLKRIKDQLGDTATVWERLADAVEDSARRQLDKLKDLQDELRGFFGGLQQSFLNLGIVNDPLGPFIASFEKLLNLSGRAQNIANPAMRVVNALRQDAAQKRGEQERLNGLDGTVPIKGGGMVSAGNVSGGTILDIAKQVHAGQHPAFKQTCAWAVSKIYDTMGVELHT